MEGRGSDQSALMEDAWFSVIADHVPFGALHVFDKDLRHVYSAGRGVKRPGISSPSLPNKSIREVLGGELAGMMQENLNRVLEGENVSFEGEYQGDRFLTRAIPFLNPTDGQTYVLLHSMNLSELDKLSARELGAGPVSRRMGSDAVAAAAKKSLALSSWMVEEASVPLCVVLDDGKLTRSNRAFCNLFGYTYDDLSSLSIHDVLSEPQAESWADLFRKSSPGNKISFSSFGKKKDGSFLPVKGELAGNPDERGTCLISISEDTPAADDQKGGSWENERNFKLISENVTDLIAVLDLKGRHVYVNPSYKSMFDEPDAILGKGLLDLIHPDDRAEAVSIFKEGLRTGLEQRAEFRLIMPDQSIKHVEARGKAIRDKNGKLTNVVVVSRDITENKRLEEQYLRAQRLESLGTLASGISHDLNNVLTPVILGVEALKRSLVDEKSKSILRMIESSLSRGKDIVKQVLTFARGVEGEHMLIQPRHIIHEAVSLMRATFPKSISIVEATPQILWLVNGDVTKLTQLIMNLGVNARDAMPEGGTLNVTAENIIIDQQFAVSNHSARPGHYVLITVHDTGIGMSPEVMEHIYEPFFTTKESGKGTGLGLSIVSDIVKGHDGFIVTSSEPGKGSSFGIYIPAKERGEASIADETEGSPPVGNNELLLVVDDEVSVCQITKQTLESYGYRVLIAHDGAEAVGVYAEEPKEIALVLIDMMMPVMDGPRTIRALRKINPAVKIAATSGLVSEGNAALEGEYAPNAFIAKPYTAAKFLRTIHSVLHTAS